ncbi:MAG: hypothetical protein ABIR13_08145 [Polaromonas sp.]
MPAQRQAWFAARWDTLLECGEAFHPEARPNGAPRGTQGRHKQSKAHNLLRRLRVYRQDVSGCFRTQHGASTFFTLRSYLATMRKQRACLFECLISTFTGQPIQPCWAG